MATRIAGVERRPFDILGISESEEHVYRWLLSHAGATVQQVARALSLPVRGAQHVLDAIEARGMATHSPERPRKYLPSPPDMAVEALILHHEGELQRARVEAKDLQGRLESARSRNASPVLVELITSREAEWQAFDQMQRAARSEVLFFERAPLRLTRVEVEDDYATQYKMHAKGISYRCIVDAEFLTLPGVAASVQRSMRNGQEYRVVPELPSKLVLVDRRIALVPLNPKDAGGHVLLVRASALLDTLYALFEMLWRSAAPVYLSNMDGATAASDSAKPIDELLTLLTMGINDKTIASELDLSMRTLNRRVSELMSALGARSRFQAGWLAAFQHMTQDARASPAKRLIGAKAPRRKSAAKPD